MFDGLVVAYILNFVSHTGCLADFFFAIGLGTQQLLSSKKAGCLSTAHKKVTCPVCLHPFTKIPVQND